jgi:hypothetical protein
VHSIVKTEGTCSSISVTRSRTQPIKGLMFSHWCNWQFQASEMWHCISGWTAPNSLKKCSAFTTKGQAVHDEHPSPNNTASHPRRQGPSGHDPHFCHFVECTGKQILELKKHLLFYVGPMESTKARPLFLNYSYCFVRHLQWPWRYHRTDWSD